MIQLIHCDLNICGHCQLKCAACSHFSPFSKPWFMSPESMAHDLSVLKPIVHFEFLGLLGGEPLLHHNLTTCIEVARDSGVSDAVMVITNGRLIPKMPPIFWSTLASAKGKLRLSIYPGLPDDTINIAHDQCVTYGVEFLPIEYSEFYLQLKPNPDDGVETFNKCEWRKDCFTVHEGFFYLCPQSVFMNKMVQDLIPTEDGLSLTDLTEEKLSSFLNRTEPLKACAHCCGGHNETIPWHEAKNKEQWIKESTCG